MKLKFFSVFAIFLFCVFGCGDEGVLLDGLVPTAPPLSDVGPVPPDIQEIIWGKDVDTLMAELEAAIEGDRDILVESLIHQICLRREQEAYYTKYINAGGVAIMGNDYIDDRFFYAARDIVLGMTWKRPELREQLSPMRENRPGAIQQDGRHDVTGRVTVSRKYRMILVHVDQGSTVMPELHLGSGAFNFPALGSGSHGIYGRVVVQRSSTGGRYMSPIFIHEFAHAIHDAIPLLDPTFVERLEAAYDAAKNDSSYFGSISINHYALTNQWEYWAVSTKEWFMTLSIKEREHTRNRFSEMDPLMYALLAEWFDLINLRAVETRVYE